MQPHSIDWDYSAFLVVEVALNAKIIAAISRKRKTLHCDGLHPSKFKRCD